MNRLILSAIAIAAMIGCDNSSSSSDSISAADIEGVWVFDKMNNEAIETNNIFSSEFKSGGLQDYIQWADIDGVNSTTIYKVDVPYTVQDNILTLESTTDYIVLGLTLDGDQLDMVEIEKIIDGTDYYEGHSYQGYRVLVDYTDNITQGSWEGRATAGRDDDSNPYLRIKYNADGTYDFQYKDSLDEEWSDKVDNDGTYYLFGDLLSSVWTNDINSGIEGSASESWIITIADDTMTWSATRAESHYECFEFVRVE